MNINNYVYVKLNDKGKDVAQKNCHSHDFRTLKNGWSEWQLWVLMRTFGNHLSIAGDVVFENNEMRYRKPKDS